MRSYFCVCKYCVKTLEEVKKAKPQQRTYCNYLVVLLVSWIRALKKEKHFVQGRHDSTYF